MSSADLWGREDGIDFPRLPPAEEADELTVHLAAVEYTLLNSITIDGPEDIQSRVHWKAKLEPFEHQIRNLITFCRRAPVAMICDDVGLGKTISAGLILSELRVRKRVDRALVLASKILLEQWREELAEKFGIAAVCGSGKEVRNLVQTRSPVVITTYDTFRDYSECFEAGAFQMVILDEAGRLRNLFGTAKRPKLASAVERALHRRFFKYVLMLTATPLQNRLWDLYSLMHLLSVARAHENPLGTEDQFAVRYIADKPNEARKLHPGRKEEFRRKLADYIVRTSRKSTHLPYPERVVKTVPCTPVTAERSLALVIGAAMRGTRVNALSRSSMAEALMSSPQALLQQITRMVANGTVPQDILTKVSGLVREAGRGCKLPVLMATLTSLRNENPGSWRAVVFTRRIETQRQICDALAEAGISCGTVGGDRSGQNSASVRGFCEDPPRFHVLVSTDAGAEGINLQACNVVVNYDLPWNPMIVEQRIGRVQRLMSKHAKVSVLNLVTKGSVEEALVARMMQRLQTICDCIGDMESILEVATPEDGSFEEQLKELVINALMGQNTEEAARKLEASIEAARRLYDEERDAVERTLGTLDAMHSAGPRPPRLEPATPRLGVRDFVVAALQREGATVTFQPNGQFIVKKPGEPTHAGTLNENDPDLLDQGVGMFGGKRVQLYAPGKTAFDRLVGRWEKTAAHRVFDLRPMATSLARETAARWVEALDIGATLADVASLRDNGQFAGALQFKASASVAHDRYERLCSVRVHNSQHETASLDVPPERGSLSGDVDLTPVSAEHMPSLQDRIEHDEHLAGFCGFYEQRRKEERARAGHDPQLERVVDEQFGPSLAATLVAAEGHLYSVSEVDVRYSPKGGAVYRSRLRVLGATGQVLSEPERDICQATGKRVPKECLGRCAISEKVVLRHLLVQSEASQRFALEEHSGRCGVTGKVLLSDELGVSTVSGKTVDKTLLRKSAISGKRALEDEMVRCAFSNSLVLPVEASRSEVSGKWFRTDQGLKSAVSGVSGHETEFMLCGVTEVPILPEEGRKSTVSGKFARLDQFTESERTAGQFGLKSEVVRCALSGKALLRSEAVFSKVSGKAMDPDLAGHCACSGAPALPTELVACEVSGGQILPAEAGWSDLSKRRVDRRLLLVSAFSGRKGVRDEVVTCEFSGTEVLSDEVVTSEVSGRALRKDREAQSAVSGKRGDLSEFVTCAVSQAHLLPEEAGKSDVSGLAVDRRLLLPSPIDGRLGLTEEFTPCAFSGTEVLKDELVPSQVSGKLLRKDRQVVSAVSGKRGDRSEFVECEATKAPLLPEEAGISDLSRRRVDRRLLKPSLLSGRLGLAEEFGRCEFSDSEVLSDELVRSDISGRFLRKDRQLHSAVSSKSGDQSEFVECSVTKSRILPLEAGRSDVTGRVARLDLIVPSDRPPGRRGLREETRVCCLTSKRLLVDEVETSAASGLVGDRDQMVRSDASGRWALPGEVMKCPETGATLLPDETAVCGVTGARVDRRVLATSDLTGTVGSAKLLRTCPETGKRGFPQELVVCSKTGEIVAPEALDTCTATGNPVLKRLLKPCAVTGRLVREDRMVSSEKSGRLGHPDSATRCVWTGKRLLTDEVATCRWTDVVVDHDLIGANGVSRPAWKLATEWASVREATGSERDAAIAAAASQGLRAKGARVIGSTDAPVGAALVEWSALLGLQRKGAIFLFIRKADPTVLGLVCKGTFRGGTWSSDGQ